MTQVIKIKRNETSATATPTALAEGELAAALAADPVRMWIGTPGGVKELFAGTAIEDAENDAVYGRCNGDWVKVPTLADAPPANPAPDALWWDTTSGRLFVWFNEQQWVEVLGPEGPQGLTGPEGPQGDPGPPGVATLTHATGFLAANVTITAPNFFFDGPSVNLGPGTWFVTGTVVVTHASSPIGFVVRLWMGAGAGPILADAAGIVAAAGWPAPVSLSGIVSNPAAPVRISVAQAASTGGVIARDHYAAFTPDAPPQQSNIVALRIA